MEHQLNNDHQDLQKKVRVSILDDEKDFVSSMQMVLNTSEYFICHSAYTSPLEALEAFRIDPPDMILIDVHMPYMTGLDVVKAMVAEQTPSLLIMLSSQNDVTTVWNSLVAGAKGYIEKPIEVKDLLAGLDILWRGGSFMSPGIALKIVNYINEHSRAIGEDHSMKLTTKEKMILRGLAEGKSAKNIAENHMLSFHTVRTHIRNIYEKLQVSSKAEAIRLYQEQNERGSGLHR